MLQESDWALNECAGHDLEGIGHCVSVAETSFLTSMRGVRQLQREAIELPFRGRN
jgi:hypothetical protein